ncbi:MAG: hypothetical protein J2P48_09765 [Alphaproteobacteria bacterium]|nr:hypothetical protein [Alphaproteobacteria bacterium]
MAAILDISEVPAFRLLFGVATVCSTPAAETTLQTEAADGLSGLPRADMPRLLAQWMAQTRLAAWRFEPGEGNAPARDHVEWIGPG